MWGIGGAKGGLESGEEIGEERDFRRIETGRDWEKGLKSRKGEERKNEGKIW